MHRPRLLYFEMESNSPDPAIANDTGIPPIYFGKSFFCYRDVNKAIERHRELFGLRLALKRAIKLENYCLTVDQMKDLNLRLKYGALDYHCFAATGRPGRPGNDERCPQLVRLKLSPDAQSLMVYETHNHNIVPLMEPSLTQTQASAGQQKCTTEELTVTPIYSSENITSQGGHRTQLAITNSTTSLEKNVCSVSQQSSNSFIIKSNNSFTSLIPLNSPTPSMSLLSNSDSESPTVNSKSIISFNRENSCPKPSDNPSNSHEKITVKLKKSECVPNEMVVVGSLRHVQEQQQKSVAAAALSEPATICKPISSIGTSTSSSSTTPETKCDIATQCSNMKPVNVVSKPALCPKNTGLTRIDIIKQSDGTLKANYPIQIKKSAVSSCLTIKPLAVLKPSPVGIKTKPVILSLKSPEVAPKKVLSLKSKVSLLSKPGQLSLGKSNISPKLGTTNVPVVQGKPTILKQSTNMKQVIIDKPKAAIGSTKLIDAKKNVSPSIKPITNGTLKSNHLGAKHVAIKTNPSMLKPHPSMDRDKVNNSSPVFIPSPECVQNKDRSSGGKCLIKNKNGMSSSRPSSLITVNGNSLIPTNQLNGNKICNGSKKLKKKPTRFSDSSDSNIDKKPIINTELGFNEKQNLAHGILMQLLKVTSQLPMGEFSHALETIETLTDAFRLNHKVSLAISHDDEKDDFVLPFIKEEKDICMSSTTNDLLLSHSQYDGQLDPHDLLRELTHFQEALLNPGQDRRVLRQEEVMEVEPVKVQELNNRTIPQPAVPTSDHCKAPSDADRAKGVKRSVSVCFGSSPSKKNRN